MYRLISIWILQFKQGKCCLCCLSQGDKNLAEHRGKTSTVKVQADIFRSHAPLRFCTSCYFVLISSVCDAF